MKRKTACRISESGRLMGGFSSEREVSLNSGAAIVVALQSRGIDAHPFDPKAQDIVQLKALGFQTAFNTLHGTYGEDGTVQGLLEALGVPYTGCGVMASAIGMDKYRTKLVWQGLGLPVPEFAVLHDNSDFAAIERELGLPLFVKPAVEGSSVGVVKGEEAAAEAAYQSVKTSARRNLAERFIGGGEYTCAVLNRPSAAGASTLFRPPNFCRLRSQIQPRRHRVNAPVRFKRSR